MSDAPARLVRLGCVPLVATIAAMQAFTESRHPDTPDEIWLCEHAPVYTQGLAGRAEHLLDPGDIPVVQTNRGGQVTYHGPGQVIAYPLVDLGRLGIYVREYVFRLEHAVLRVLAALGVTGHRIHGAPGIYVRPDDPFGHTVPAGPGPGRDRFEGFAKIAALGIKVSRQRAYHGLALNVGMDLRPFDRIDPCGYPGLRTVDLSTIGVSASVADVTELLGAHLANGLRR